MRVRWASSPSMPRCCRGSARGSRRRRREGDDERPDVLHLFARPVSRTLAMASAGAAVVHLDAARPTVAWARRNAELSGLADRPDPLDRRRRDGLRRTRGATRPPVLRHRPRPAQLRARGRRPALAARGRPGGLLAACAAVLEPGRVHAPDRAHPELRPGPAGSGTGHRRCAARRPGSRRATSA